MVTRSEALVAELCRRSFLSLWSEPNPIARPGKELCDLLVVCSPYVIIFSVKEIGFRSHGELEVEWSRWRKKAIDESAKQLYGAERWLRSAERVLRADGSPGLKLPTSDQLRLFRVAVALGGQGAVPYEQGDFGKGFVHVLDDESLRTVMQELDTITDFVDYLEAKQSLLNRASAVLEGREHDLLAMYIHKGRTFPSDVDLVVVGDDLWSGLTKKPEWRARKGADRESYVWDGLIETMYELGEHASRTPAEAMDSLDGALGFMARETRFSRRALAAGFNEFMRDAAARKTRARMMPGLSGVYYVFLASDRSEKREARRRELGLRCFVARGISGAETVIGIATERHEAGAGFSIDAVRITKPTWNAQDQTALEGIQHDLGYFANPKRSRAVGDEFPGATHPRNRPCPCGSGKKYKRCHGQRITR